MTNIEDILLFDKHLILDYIPSWPKQVTEIISLNKNELLCFINEDSRIDVLAEENVEYRVNRPFNIYQDSWDSAIKGIHNALRDWKILGFHASRLLEHEISDLRNNGFQELTHNFAISRIEYIYHHGYINKDFRDKLISKKEFKEDNRLGKSFFFHALSTFNDDGLTRLFNSWGGESIYRGHEKDSPLQQIGKPYIVVASLDIIVDEWHPIGERLLNIYLRKGEFSVQCDTDSWFDSHGNNRIGVLSIIEKESTLLEEISKASSMRNYAEPL